MITQRGPIWTLIIDNSLLLVAGTAVGLVWANLNHPLYERFSHAVHFAVNDVGMVFFFALAVKEIVEATLPGGALESPREAAVPILAAAGGMIGPASLYAILVVALGRHDLMPGWRFPARPTSRSPTSQPGSSSLAHTRRFRFCSCWRSPTTHSA